ncbi:MAG TPA: hypothetical protein VIK47_05845 [Kiloniellales bacterium]
MRGSSPPLPTDGIYRFILWLMTATVVCGAILAIAAAALASDPALSRLGTAMAVIGGIIYAFFRWLGAREARRRQEQGAADTQDPTPEP